MLHKMSYVRGFHLIGTDGQIGHIDDFLFDAEWTVRYLVVDTSNWIGGRSVLVSPSVVTTVDSPAKKVHVRVSRDEIAHAAPLENADIELIETLPPIVII